jgi:hypothetical protein
MAAVFQIAYDFHEHRPRQRRSGSRSAKIDRCIATRCEPSVLLKTLHYPAALRIENFVKHEGRGDGRTWEAHTCEDPGKWVGGESVSFAATFEVYTRMLKAYWESSPAY